MPRSLKHIIRTYWRRPLVWGLLALAVLVGLMSEVTQSGSLRQSRPAVAMRGIRSLSELQSHQKAGTLKQVRAISLTQVRFDMARNEPPVWNESLQQHITTIERDAPELFRWLDQLPNLETLQLDYLRVNGDILRQIGALSRLEELSLAHTNIRGDDLQHLGSLSRLKTLDLSGCRIHGGLKHLAGLPELRTVIFGSLEGVNDRLIDELLHLPQIRTLVLDGIYATDPNRFVTDAGLARLATHPGLRVLYTSSHERTAGSIFPEARRILPHVTVRRTTYSPDRTARVGQVLAVQMVLLVLFVNQLLSQFAISGAGVIPGFARRHLWPPVLSMFALLVIGTLLLRQMNADWSAAIGIQCGALALSLWLLRFLVRSTGQTGNTITCVFVATLALQFRLASATWFGPTVEAWVLDDWPLLNVLGIGLMLIAGYQLICELIRLPVQLSEHGAIVGLSWSENIRLNVQRVHQIQQRRPAHSNRWAVRLAESILDRQLQSPLRANRQTLWQRARWLRIATPSQRGFWIVLLVMVSLCQAGTQLPLVRKFLGDRPGNVFSTFFAFSVLIGPGWGIAVAIWRQRLEHLAMELLRPVRREQLRAELFTAILIDLVPVSALTTLWAVAALRMGAHAFPDVTFGPQLAGMALLTGLALMVFVLSLILARSVWLTAAWAFVGGILWLSGAAVGWLIPWSRSPLGALGGGLALLLFSSLTFLWCWQSWNRRETGAV